MKININSEDFGAMCICAVRYCQGRRTYMPSIIIPIVLDNLDELSDKDLNVLINDCKFQRRYESYGDPKIDRPMWLSYEAKLVAERDRRRLA